MPVFFLALLIILTVQETVFEVHRTRVSDQQQTQQRSLGTELLIVRNAVDAYRRANPTAQGPIAVSSLGLPAWFSSGASVNVLIEANQAYVYYTPTHLASDIATTLGEDAPALTGIAREGRLHSPHLLTLLPLPALIPDGSIVLML